MEITARNNLATAMTENVDRLAAAAELGDNAVVGGAAATGARAVLADALATKTQIDAQQAFHDARSKWAADNLKPVAASYNAAVGMRDGLIA